MRNTQHCQQLQRLWGKQTKQGGGEATGNVKEKNTFQNLKARDDRHLYYKELIKFSTDSY